MTKNSSHGSAACGNTAHGSIPCGNAVHRSAVQNRGAYRSSANKNIVQKKRAVRKRSGRKKKAGHLRALVVKLALAIGIVFAAKNAGLWGSGIQGSGIAGENQTVSTGVDPKILADMKSKGYPEELIELLERNEETLDYVESYPDREKYQDQFIDLTQDFQAGEVPLLMQWDKRWGYDMYGDGMIGLSGCGPVCLNMAYLYFTEDTDMTPKEMAAFAYENGYYTEAGTSWNFWTEGAAALGLIGDVLSLDETAMKDALDSGGLIVCSMRPGDFTTIGHFILIRGYDENGFYVNDPNRRSNSGKQWDFDILCPQIKNLWVLRK